MKYSISHNRMKNLVGNLVQEKYPNFNGERAKVATYSNGDKSFLEYYDPYDNKTVFGKYYFWENELQLNHELFSTLEGFFGDDMTFVLDWFNEEFDQDAENVTF